MRIIITIMAIKLKNKVREWVVCHLVTPIH